MSLGLMILCNWIAVNVPLLQAQAQVFFGMVLIGSTIGSIEYFFEKTSLFSFVYAGKTWKVLAVGFIAGGIAGLLMQAVNFSVLPLPFSAIQSTQGIVGISAAFIFVVVIAPYAEEKFFRMTLFPSARVLLGNIGLSKDYASIAAIVLVGLLFGFYHFSVFGGVPSLMFSAFIFSTIAIFLNYSFKSAYAGYGLHVVNNFLAFMALGGSVFV